MPTEGKPDLITKEAINWTAEIPVDRPGMTFHNNYTLVDQLANEPYTRQAYLPIFFPEDTGAVHGGRIPCTLGYHFMMRGDQLHMWYHIRSCDLHRHFRDDLYLAVRLQLWVLDALENYSRYWTAVSPGNLYFAAYSLHLHRGDERNVIDH
jgi:thymidylate synthase